MAKQYTVLLPDKSKLTIEGPEDATDDELIGIAKQEIARARPNQRFAEPAVQRLGPKSGADYLKPVASDATSLFTTGVTGGLKDELAGGAGALLDAVRAPFSDRIDFNPANSYRAYRDLIREQDRLGREQSPWLGTGAEVAGNLAALPTKAIAGTQSLLAALKNAPKLAALQGAISGFGYGEGADASLGGGAFGGAIGGTLGLAVPIAASVVSKGYNVARDFLNPNNGLARELVSKAMAADAIAPRAAATALTDANARGVPSMLADQGENLRNLAASVARKPGPSQRLVKSAVEERQAQQGNRIRGAIERDLGRVDNPFAVSDQLSVQAKRAAAPLYEQAYSAPFSMPEEVAALMTRPSVQRALGNATRIAKEEGRNPRALGFIEGDGGQVALPNAPTMQSMDYVKRGLDDVLEKYRDPATGRLALDTEGRAIEDTRRALVDALDQSGEAGVLYKQARAAFAGPAGQKAALAKGQAALNASDQEIERIVANLKPGEREQFALGMRSALVSAMERRVDGGDKVKALLGTPRKRAALAQVFGGEESFGRFLATMADEAQAARTFQSVTGGSQTAERQAIDAATNDTGLLQDLGGTAIKGMASGGPTNAIVELLARAKDVGRFGAGRSGERAREQAAALLTETNPEALRESMRKALRDQAIRRVRANAQTRSAIQAAIALSRGAGGIGGYAMRPPAE